MRERLRFGDFELDVEAYALRRAGDRVKLEKLPMEILIQLASRAGTLVERDVLKQAQWGSTTFVDYEAAINTAIRKIRRALGDNVDAPRFIETVVGKGYRFIAPVARGTREPAAPLPHCWLTRGKRRFVLQPGDNLMGRDPQASLQIDEPPVSRRHARISIESERVVLEDLRSRNGTFLNGRRVETPAALHDGDVIGLGPVVLRFHARADLASTAPVVGPQSRRRKSH